jgi:hypothetical protein
MKRLQSLFTQPRPTFGFMGMRSAASPASGGASFDELTEALVVGGPPQLRTLIGEVLTAVGFAVADAASAVAALAALGEETVLVIIDAPSASVPVSCLVIPRGRNARQPDVEAHNGSPLREFPHCERPFLGTVLLDFDRAGT